jgi:hypothetical protein
VNPLVSRELMAQAIIALALCVGAWMLVVKPQVQELSRLEQEMAENAASAAGMDVQMLESLGKRIEPVRGQLKLLIDRNQLVDDSSRMYGAVMDLAEAHGVRVQSLQPSRSSQSSQDGQVTIKHADLSIAGPYANVAAFLGSMRTLAGFIRPASLQVVPATSDANHIVTANFGFDVLSFKISDELMALGAGGGASQVSAASEGSQHAQP